jgi:hypothetical protein
MFDCGEGSQRQMQRATGLVQVDEIYLTHYGKGCTTEQLARKWNGGGPAGDKKTATIPYWNKVKKHL